MTRAALGDVAALVRERASASAVRAATAESLARLVPADVVSFNAFDLRARRYEVHSFPQIRVLDVDLAPRLLDVADDHPMIRSHLRPGGGDAPRRLSDVTGRAELRRTRAWSTVLRRTRAWSTVLRPFGVQQQAAVLAASPVDGVARGWGLNRSSSDFTDRELDLLRTAQPLLAIIDAVTPTTRRHGTRVPRRTGG